MMRVLALLLPQLASGLIVGSGGISAQSTSRAAPSMKVDIGRRLALERGSIAAAATAAALLVQPQAALAAGVKMPKVDLQLELVNLLRVQESCGQQTRLVKTGKFKELQRLNVKRAIRMMIENSDMQSRFARASIYVNRDDVTKATEAAALAVEGLNQIIEYFPQDLVANDLSPEQKTFVINALASTSSNIDRFLALMPPDKVAAAKAQIEEENALNAKEYEQFNDETMVNMPAKK